MSSPSSALPSKSAKDGQGKKPSQLSYAKQVLLDKKNAEQAKLFSGPGLVVDKTIVLPASAISDPFIRLAVGTIKAGVFRFPAQSSSSGDGCVGCLCVSESIDVIQEPIPMAMHITFKITGVYAAPNTSGGIEVKCQVQDFHCTIRPKAVQEAIVSNGGKIPGKAQASATHLGAGWNWSHEKEADHKTAKGILKALDLPETQLANAKSCLATCAEQFPAKLLLDVARKIKTAISDNLAERTKAANQNKTVEVVVNESNWWPEHNKDSEAPEDTGKADPDEKSPRD
jgi:hypothetical protein